MSTVCIVHVEHALFLSFCTQHKTSVKIFISPGYIRKDLTPYGRDLETHRKPGFSSKMFLKIFGYTI